MWELPSRHGHCGEQRPPAQPGEAGFPHSIASVTGAFAWPWAWWRAGLHCGGAIGNRVALATGAACLSGAALAALAMWLPQLRSRTQPAATTATPPHGKKYGTRPGLAGDAVSGLNSTIYYIHRLVALILTDAGLSAEQAGSLHGVMQLATAVPGLLLGPVLRRLQDQRWAAASVAALSGVALMGFQLAPQFAFAWATLFGLGAGGAFHPRAGLYRHAHANAHQAASLSGMAQCVGYLLAAVGPMAAGWLHDLLGGWQIPPLVRRSGFTAAVVGIFAGRNVHTDA
jgi:CP family cyanate transporter-like MFS transporter